MNTIKRVTALLLALSMVMALLTGCGKKEEEVVIGGGASSAAEALSDQSAEASTPAEDASEADASAADESAAPEESTPDASAPDESAQEEAPAAGNYPYDYTIRTDMSGINFDALRKMNNTSVVYDWSVPDLVNYPKNAWPNYYEWGYSDYSGITKFDTEEKVVYLTMDEGYENGCTPTILDTLKEKGVHAVFFITKQFYDSDPELIQRMIDEGHIVGNHTCKHPGDGMPSLGLDAEYEDIKWLNDAVYDTFGYQMKLFRFPTGVGSQQSIALLEAMGYTSVFWSFAHADYSLENQPDPAATLTKCVDALQPGAIYLLHAVSTTNTAILGDFIDQARAAGYEFGEFPVE